MSTLVCPRCPTPLHVGTARPTPIGYVHTTCRCGECGTNLPRGNTTGYCRRCYDRVLRAGRIPTKIPRRHVCVRCGVAADGLCDDCWDVTRDLGEAGRWVA